MRIVLPNRAHLQDLAGLLCLCCALLLASLSSAAVEKPVPTPDSPLHAPITIDTVHIAKLFRDALIERVSTRRSGYDLWGREQVSIRGNPVHFPDPLCYPFQYTEDGARKLAEKLQNSDEVIGESVKVATFPSVHLRRQYLLKAFDRAEVLTDEMYVEFALRLIPEVRYMSFPCMLVGVLETDDPKRHYAELVSQWKRANERFRGISDALKRLLGVLPRKPWQSSPILTWVSSPSYSEPEFWNRYWSGTDRTVDERNRQFSSEVSLVAFGKRNILGRLHHCHGISYEHSVMDDTWRYYYSSRSWFGKVEFHQMEIGPRPPELTWVRALRSAVLINFVLPEVVSASRELANTLKADVSAVRTGRLGLFGTFSLSELSTFHDQIADLQMKLPEITSGIAYAEEAVDGYDGISEFLELPYSGPLSEDELRNTCLENLLSFGKERLLLNDRRKGKGYIKELTAILEGVRRDHAKFTIEIEAALGLLESRRSLLWSKQANLLTIAWPASGAVLGALAWVVIAYYRGKDTSTALAILVPAAGALAAAVLAWYLYW